MNAMITKFILLSYLALHILNFMQKPINQLIVLAHAKALAYLVLDYKYSFCAFWNDHGSDIEDRTYMQYKH